MFNHQRLKCYQLALEVAKRVPNLVKPWPSGTGYLQDQLKRAVCSVLLNISEGNGRRLPKDRRRFFDIARGSSAEASAAIEAAYAMQWVGQSDYDWLMDALLQVVKILYKLP